MTSLSYMYILTFVLLVYEGSQTYVAYILGITL